MEILVATCILAIIMSTIFVTFTETLKNKNYTESQAEIYQMARIALERMQEDIECSFIQTEENTEGEEAAEKEDVEAEEDLSSDIFSGTNEEIAGRDADSISFLSTKHLTLGDEDSYSGLAHIAFYVTERDGDEDEDEDEGFDLFRSDTPEYKESPEEKSGGILLCEHLHSVNFTFYNSDGDEHDDWDSSEGEFKNKLPSMVSIRLGFINKFNPEKPLIFETGIALPMSRTNYGKES